MVLLTALLEKHSIPYLRINLKWDSNGKKQPIGLPSDWSELDFGSAELEQYRNRDPKGYPYIVFKTGTTGICAIDVDQPSKIDFRKLKYTGGIRTNSVSSTKSNPKYHLLFKYEDKPWIPNKDITGKYHPADWKASGLLFERDQEVSADTLVLPSKKCMVYLQSTFPIKPIKIKVHKSKSKQSTQSTQAQTWSDLYDNLEKQPADSFHHLNPDKTTFEDFLLAVISNIHQPSEVFRAMAYAIKGSGLTVLHYQRWALKCKKYTEQEQISACQYIWSLMGSQRPKYNLQSLVKVASHYIENPRQTYFQWQFEHTFDQLKLEIPTKLYYHQYCRPNQFIEDQKQNQYIIQHSAMKTGKTYQVRQLLEHQGDKYPRVLVFSPRRIFAKNMTNDLNVKLPPEQQITCYLDLTHKKQFKQQDRLTISPESLWKLLPDSGCIPRFDLLVIDEIEAVLRQFSSTTQKKPRQSAEAFEQIITRAKHVVLSDAFVSQRCFHLLRNLGVQSHQIQYNVNTCQPTSRSAFQVSDKKFINLLVHKLKKGKRCVVFCGSKNKLELIKGNVDHHVPSADALYYMGDENNSSFENVREEWSGRDLVAYTPTITVGVNFDLKDQFDCLFVWATAYHSCNIEDVFQATLRVRELTDNIMYYCIKTKPEHTDFPENLEQAKGYLKVNEQILTDSGFRFGNAPCWFEGVVIDNLLETARTKLYFKDRFEYYLKLCGYSVSKLQETLVNNFKEAQAFDYKYRDYDEIERVKDPTQLEMLVYQNKASVAQLEQYQKYQFDKMFSGTFKSSEQRNQIFQLMFDNQQRKRLTRIYQEHTTTPELLQFNTEDHFYSACPDLLPLQLRVINDLCQALGMDSSLDQKTISFQVIKDKQPEIQAALNKLNAHHIYMDKLRKERQRTKVKQPNLWKEQLGQLAHIFSHWSGTSIKPVYTKTKCVQKRNGQRVIQSLSLEGLQPQMITPTTVDLTQSQCQVE